MAISCPSCGLDNADGATECRRCRAPFAPAEDADSGALGTLCGRCEAYNEPGVARCTTCGYKLPADAAKSSPALAKAPAVEMTPPSSGDPTLSEEIRGLALSAEEAADAGLEMAQGSAEESMPAQPAALGAPRPRGWAAAEAAMAEATQRKRAVPAVGVPPGFVQSPAPFTKTCASCAAENVAIAKFCSECGTPFAKAPSSAADAAFAREAAPPPPAVTAPAASTATEESDDWAIATDPTGRPAPTADGTAIPTPLQIELQDPEPEPLGWDVGEGAAPEEELVDAEAIAHAMDAATLASPEPQLPYQASLVVERGAAAGTSYVLGSIENIVGGAGAAIELPDPHLAARHAAVIFDEQRLMLRDEGSANGVYVKLRDAAPIEPGDYFVAGERLLRFDGACELPVGDPGETPYLGAPRPEGAVVRVTELLCGGKIGRICFRAGSTISVGRTGCDLNFPADAQLAARHAELRIAADGSAVLVDLNAAPGGVFLRLRPQQSIELQPGDVLQLGDQQLRIEVA
jgi:pSer/pThr/pTyr-binding forkhead associated (FHA) protein